jgi:hypothetical protein
MSELPDLQKSSDVSDEGGYGNKSTQAPKHLSTQALSCFQPKLSHTSTSPALNPSLTQISV